MSASRTNTAPHHAMVWRVYWDAYKAAFDQYPEDSDADAKASSEAAVAVWDAAVSGLRGKSAGPSERDAVSNSAPESQPLSGATPRTDAVWEAALLMDDADHAADKLADLARQLERELAEVKLQLESKGATSTVSARSLSEGRIFEIAYFGSTRDERGWHWTHEGVQKAIKQALAESGITVSTRGTTCPDCKGSGYVCVQQGGGPDAYEIEVQCPKCGGTGAVSASGALPK